MKNVALELELWLFLKEPEFKASATSYKLMFNVLVIVLQ